MLSVAPETTASPTTPIGDCPPIIHLWPSHPRYRVSRASLPQPGDRARCGTVKTSAGHTTEGDACVVCWDLRERAEPTRRWWRRS